MRVDETAWQELREEQQEVVSRAQAIACGWNDRAMEHRLGRSSQRLLPGVYLTVTGQPSWEQKLWAGVLFAGDGAALTAWSGLARAGLEEPSEDVHVALPHARRLRPRTFLAGGGRLVLHRTTRPLEPRATLPVLPVERCVVDACLRETSLNRVRALASNAVQCGRTTPEKLLVALEEAPQRGSGLLRAALSEVAEGARSAPEAVLARALRGSSLPPYRLNADVRDDDGTWLARGDLVIEELKLVVEVDGQRWHLSGDRWVADVERHTRLEAKGWTVLRYPASRVLRDAPGVVAEIEAVAARLQRGAA
jgi:very-short-patch-repair endonuclease